MDSCLSKNHEGCSCRAQRTLEANLLLVSAISESKKYSVKEAIEKGADVNYEGPGGGRPLHSASFAEIVELLLEKGAEVNVSDEEGFTPLMVAALNGRTKIVRLLLEKGGKTETTRLDTGETALHLAVNSNNFATAQELLDKRADVSARTTDDGSTPLHLAAEFGSKRSVDAILKHALTEKEHVLAKNKKGQTASEVASAKGFMDLANRLDIWAAPRTEAEKMMITALLTSDLEKLNEALEADADPNLITPRGDRPLHTAAMKGERLLIQRLLQKGAEKDEPDSNGYTPLMVAALNGHLEAVKELINYGSNPNVKSKFGEGAEAEWGDTALHMAVASRNVLVIRTLLDAGADVNAQCSKGNTPLHYAIDFKDVAAAQEIIKHPDCRPAKMNSDYNTPRTIADTLNHKELQNLFIKPDGVNVTAALYQGLSNDGSLSLEIITGAEIYPNEHIYKNITFPRGHVLIINYAKFIKYNARLGSSYDVKNLTILFEKMGYNVQSYENLNNEETHSKLQDFSKDDNLAKSDSVIVCMMSHGKDGSTFFTSDDEEITVHQVYEVFKNSKCPHLQGKPKIFFFNFCRGQIEEKRTENIKEEAPAVPKITANTCKQPVSRFCFIGSERPWERGPD